MEIQEKKLREIVQSEIRNLLSERVTSSQGFSLNDAQFGGSLDTNEDGITFIVHPRNEKAKRYSSQEILEGLGQGDDILLTPIESFGDRTSEGKSRVWKFRVDTYNLLSRIVQGMIFN